MLRTTRIASAVVLAGCIGCAEDNDPRTAGTRAMADSLRTIEANALKAPRANQFLNRERAAELKRLVEQTGRRNLELRYYLAYELMASGETRAAITEAESIMRDAGLSPDTVHRGNKQLFDLIALGWLRLGEQQNCALNPSAGVCILPLQGDARHKMEEGARRAIEVYSRILRGFPEDYGSRWLLNVAYLAVGEYPGKVPRAWLVPGLDRQTSAFPVFYNNAPKTGVDRTGRAGGMSVIDFNRDGLLDLLTTGQGLDDQAHLYVADGQGGYEDQTDAAGLAGITGGLNTVHADYDNDGFEDVLILRGAWMGDAGAMPMSLLRNRGDGKFDDVTFAAGLGTKHPRHTAAFADFNLDGHIDLFVGNESGVDRGGQSRFSELFMNNGDGTFTDVASKVGVNLNAFVKGVVWGDVNNDGWPDLFVSVLFGKNRLFLNRGGTSLANWRFEDVSDRAGIAKPLGSLPAWFWDADNDGWEDLVVLSYDIDGGGLHDAVAMEYSGRMPVVVREGIVQPVEHSALYRNNRDGTFTDVSKQQGLADKVIYAMGSNFGDLDNDGWLDFYAGTGNPDLRSIIPNRMFRSVEGKRFDEVTIEGGFGHLQKGHGAAFVDFDRDGDEDIYMVMGGAFDGDRFASVLFENPGWAGRHSITLELEGRTANRSAIGARVELVVSDGKGGTRSIWRTVSTGGSFGSGGTLLHVGIDKATKVDRLNIAWPDPARSTNSYRDLAADRTYRIVQGQMPQLLDRPAVPFRNAPVDAPRHAHPGAP